MELDLTNLQKHAQTEIESANSRSTESEQYPVVYTGENGKLTVRLLYNLKMGGVQRKITRHNSGKGKTPCLQVYGEDCPVCQAIANAESVNGKECGAFTKYGFKTRGACYAQIIDHDPTYFSGDNAPKKYDIVLLMYPKTVYDQINKIIVDSGSNIDKLLSKNEGIPVVIDRTQKKGNFPEYKAYVYPYGAVKSFEDDNESSGEEKFDELLTNLPNLNENFMPMYPTEELRVQVKALAETITQEYMNSNIDNPERSNNNTSQNAPEATPTDIPQSSVMNNSNPTEGRPECFGNHEDNSHKCLICPFEADCFIG